MIIGWLVSLLGRRFAATVVALWVIAIAALTAAAESLPPSTWVALKAVPHQGRSALFALAVDPSNKQFVVAGTSDGSLLRTTNGGATWSVVFAGKAYVNTVAFSPAASRVVLAGTRGSGALVSRDGGATWSTVTGLDGRNVRTFAFALTLIAAGTDRGVFTSPDGASWTQSGLSDRSVNALAVEAIHAPVRLVAGTDIQESGGVLPLYQSVDGGATWTQFTPAISGTITIKLAAGPLPPTGNVRPLVLGTNSGLFASNDNGATFNTLSAGGLLPTTDYTQVAFVTDHSDHFYAASDGGGSGSGGLWRTRDGGQSFISLQPPALSVTALAVSNDESPTLYVATFDPSTHIPSLWVYFDTGGTPQVPGSVVTATASGARQSHRGDASLLNQILGAPGLPYVALGVGALAVLLTAIASHLRARIR